MEMGVSIVKRNGICVCAVLIINVFRLVIWNNGMAVSAFVSSRDWRLLVTDH